MKKHTILALTAVVAMAGAAEAGVGKGQKAPEFSVTTLKGGKLSLAPYKGKVVFLDFWAQWCEPCKKELPELQKLAKAYAGKNVVILTINIDKEKANAERMATQLGLTFDVGLDPSGAVAGQYDLPKMPTSFVIDQNGVVRFVNDGFDDGDVEKFKKEIGSLLK